IAHDGGKASAARGGPPICFAPWAARRYSNVNCSSAEERPMAKAAGKAKRPEPPKRPPRSEDPRERILAAAMEVAVRIGWRRAALADIAEAAEVSLAELHGHFADKAAMLRGIVDFADGKVLAGASEPDAESSARDRLFD